MYTNAGKTIFTKEIWLNEVDKILKDYGFIRENDSNKYMNSQLSFEPMYTADLENIIPIYNKKHENNIESFCVLYPVGDQIAVKSSHGNNNNPVAAFKISFNESVSRNNYSGIVNIVNKCYSKDRWGEFNRIIHDSSSSDETKDMIVYKYGYYSVERDSMVIKDSISNGIEKQNRIQEMLYGDKDISSEEAYRLDVYNDILVDVLGVSQETVDVIVGIMGKTQETYDAILQYITGFRDLNQIGD